jgi:hypothetical protein
VHFAKPATSDKNGDFLTGHFAFSQLESDENTEAALAFESLAL